MTNINPGDRPQAKATGSASNAAQAAGQRPEAGPLPGLGQSMAMLDGFGPAMTMWRVAAIDIPTRIGAEMTGFMMHRLQAQAEQWAHLAQCRTLDEVIDRQAAFARTTVAEYTREATTIVEDIQDVLSERPN